MVQGTGPDGRIIAEDIEKFIKEGGVKIRKGLQKDKDAHKTSFHADKKDKEVMAGASGYDEHQVSELQAVKILISIFWYDQYSVLFFLGICLSCN